MSKKTILKIDPFDFTSILLRILSIICLIFGIIFFKINPIVFTLLFIIGIILILITKITRIVLTEDNLYIEHNNLIPRLSRKQVFKLKDIKIVGFEKEINIPGRAHVPLGEMTYKPNTITMIFNDNTEYQLKQIGSERQFIELSGHLHEMINK